MINLIVDSDFAGDHDDAGGLAICLGLALAGEANLLAATSTWDDSGAQMVMGTFLNYYGFGAVPCGANKTTASPSGVAGYWSVGFTSTHVPFFNPYSGSTTNVPDAITTLRTALHNAADGSVTFLTLGELWNLQQLMQSAADGIDARTGLALLTAKVAQLVVMGGDYPTGAEHNFSVNTTAAAAANYVCANWPSAIPCRFIGFTPGNSVTTGSTLSTWCPASDPVREAYATQTVPYPSWGALAALLAIRGLSHGGTTYFVESAQGTNAVNATTGGNTFTTGSGTQTYCTLNLSAASYPAILDPLMTQGATRPPTSYVPVLFWDGTDAGFPVIDRTGNGHGGSSGGTPTPTLSGSYYDFTGNGSGLSTISTPSAADLKYDTSHPVTLICEAMLPSTTPNITQPLVWVSHESRPSYGLFLPGSAGPVHYLEQDAGSTSQASAGTATAGRWFVALGCHDTGRNQLRAALRDQGTIVRQDLPSIEGATAGVFGLSGTGPLKLASDTVGGPDFTVCKIGRVYVIPAVLNWTDGDVILWCPFNVGISGSTITMRFGLAFAGPFTGTTAGWRVIGSNGSLLTVSSVSFAGQTVTLNLASAPPGGTTTIWYANGDTADSASLGVKAFRSSFTSPAPAGGLLLKRRRFLLGAA